MILRYSALQAKPEVFRSLTGRSSQKFEALLPRFNKAWTDFLQAPFIDGTERPVRRLSDPERQKTFYSGKKKEYTVKNLVLTAPDRRALFLSQTYEGKKPDKAIADEEDYRPPRRHDLVFRTRNFTRLRSRGTRRWWLRGTPRRKACLTLLYRRLSSSSILKPERDGQGHSDLHRFAPLHTRLKLLIFYRLDRGLV